MKPISYRLRILILRYEGNKVEEIALMLNQFKETDGKQVTAHEIKVALDKACREAGRL